MTAITDELARRIQALSPAQQAWLRQRQAQADNGSGGAAAEMSAAPGNDWLPLTPGQRQLWVTQRLQPESSAYHIALRWEVAHGELNAVALQTALQAVVDRHAPLRVEIVEQDGLAYQRILPALTCRLDDLMEAGTEAEADYQAYAGQPFDLGRAPLWRAGLWRRNGSGRILILVFHHLIADGWSRGILVNELSACYRAALSGETAPLPALPLAYADYLRQQQIWLQSPASRRQAAYWRERLGGLEPLELSVEAGNLANLDYRSGTSSRRLPPQIQADLQIAAKRLGVTPFMLLLTAFNLLLHRYTGRGDIAVGVPVAGRQSAAGNVGGLVGFFVNTLVIRCRPPAPEQVASWLDAVKYAVADAFDHADLPFASVVESLANERDPSRTPLFEVMFQYQSNDYRQQNAEVLNIGVPDLEIRQSAFEPAHTKFDMSWHALERESGLLLAVEYRSRLFGTDYVDNMLAHFEQLLGAVLAGTQTHVGRLPLLGAAESEALRRLQQGPGPLRQAAASNLIEGFEAQVRVCPEAVAVSGDGQQLSYAELNAAANRLAHRLLAAGVGAETLVGVCLPRRPQLMVALLAVLKAGAAYLPLDPALPAERLNFMVQDAGIRVLIADRRDAGRVTPGAGSIQVMLADSAEEQTLVAGFTDENPARYPHPSRLAYLIYTSGSSGRPKGALLTHGGLMHYLNWCLERYPLHQGRGAPVNSSIGFDATITGLFAPLLAGKSVCLLEGADPLAELAAVLADDYSLVKLTPAHLSALQPLLAAAPQPLAQNMPRAFIIGGEALTEAHIEFWRSRFPDMQLINEYGPTETVVGCCYYRSQPNDTGAIPIGHPIAGAAIYLLDRYWNPVPVGAVGEIFIGGAGMARGYLNRPDLSAERFLPDPFAGSRHPGAVMYRSGDLGYMRPDGMLVYLGRADRQLQLRGYRIEPGEIESALCRLPEVAEAVVEVRSIGDAPTLVAYLRLDAAWAGNAVHGTRLRERLAGWLPPYMLPAHFVAVEAFLLTGNGKLDRAALPLPRYDSEVTADAPDSPEEALLLQVWQTVLNRTDFGVHDNFFQLGGDSISAMQIVARIRQHGYELAPTAIFERQNVAGQAALLKPLPSREWAAASGEALLAPMQWAFFQQVAAGTYPQPNHYNQSVLLDVAAEVDTAGLQQALQALAGRHDALRLRFRPPAADRPADDWRQFYGDAAQDISLCVQRLDPQQPADAALRAEVAAAQTALDIVNGPLLKAWLLVAADGRQTLLLVAHHLIVDGVSWRLLLADLDLLYRTLLSGGTPPTPMPVPPFSVWTRALLRAGVAFAEDLPYWLAACAEVANWPGCDTVEFEADTSALETVVDGTAALSANGGWSGLEQLILTALAQTLSRWLRSDTLVVDVESHGRQGFPGLDEAMSGTVGWFTARFPLRIVLPGGAPEVQLAEVERLWQAVPNHGLSYGVLRMQQRLPSASPARLAFNYLGSLDAGFTGGGLIGGLAEESVPAQRSAAARRPYPLEVAAWQRGGRLHLLWRFAPEQLPRPLVEQLAKRCAANLQTLVKVVAVDYGRDGVL